MLQNCCTEKISYTVEIKYRRTKVKEIRYQQLPASQGGIPCEAIDEPGNPQKLSISALS